MWCWSNRYFLCVCCSLKVYSKMYSISIYKQLYLALHGLPLNYPGTWVIYPLDAGQSLWTKKQPGIWLVRCPKIEQSFHIYWTPWYPRLWGGVPPWLVIPYINPVKLQISQSRCRKRIATPAINLECFVYILYSLKPIGHWVKRALGPEKRA